MDWLARLVALRDKRQDRFVVGLNSGTSADGIDVALVLLDGHAEETHVTTIRHETVPYPADLRARLLATDALSAADVADLNFLVGEAFAQATLDVLAMGDIPPANVDLIGSHGQTLVHRPRSAGFRGATLQIGEAAVIAERVGAPVVSDFRVRDVAAGGEGAPLVPLVDHYLFREPGKRRALQNIGGIANVTLVSERLEDLVAFDTGPGNMALDMVTAAASGGAERYDDAGRRAARGQVDRALVEELFANPFFALPPPRSTGRETFGAVWVRPLLERFRGREDDLLATLTRFTAEAIHRSYADRGPDEVLVSGGGVHNATLMAHLAELFAPIRVGTTDEDMIDPDAKEAIAFAVLANETVQGLPGNVPAATGAVGPRVLGKICPP